MSTALIQVSVTCCVPTVMYWEGKWDKDGLEMALTAGHTTSRQDTHLSEIQSMSVATKKLHQLLHRQPSVLQSFFSVQIYSNMDILKNYIYINTHKTL